MIIHAIRFRQSETQRPRGYRFRPGSGKFRSMACVGGSAHDVMAVAAAVRFALTGRTTPGTAIIDATLHLSDDAGDTWLVDRNDRSLVCLKNGAPVTADSPLTYLQAALLDRDVSDRDARTLHVGYYRLHAQGQNVRSVALGNSDYVDPGIRTAILQQINQISDESRHIFADALLAKPKVMTTLVRFLEPLHAQIADCEKELRSLSAETQISPDQMEKLRTEIALLERIAAMSGPILQPEKRSQGLREELAKTDAALAELLAQAGLSAPPTAKRVTDWRKPIEALARLEAYAKLIRANQGTRTYLDQNITPVYREYLKTIDEVLVRDRQVISELESCLACLTLQTVSTGMQTTESAPAIARATWFDRFKGREESAEDVGTTPERALDVESAKLAVEYALGRLTEVQDRMGVTKAEFSAMNDKVGQSQEELIAIYGRLKDAWSRIADEFKLPRDLSLKQLLSIVVSHTRMVALVDKRESLQSDIHAQSGKHAQLEQLLLEWRALTGSQKQTDLSHPTIVLSEARDVLRFLPNKKERLRKLEESRVAAAVSSRLSARLKAKYRHLTAEWQKCLAGIVAEGETGPRIAPHHEGWPDWFAKAQLLRSLALVYQSAAPEADARILAAPGHNTPLMIYTGSAPLATEALRESFVKAVESEEGDTYHLFALADDETLAMLSTLGLGVAREVDDPTEVHVAAPVVEKPQPATHFVPPKPRVQTPTIITRAPAPVVTPVVSRPRLPLAERDPILSTKAREALEILTTKR